MTAPEGELPPRVNLFPTRDGMCVSRDSTYKGNIPYVLASELEAEKQRGLRAVEEVRAAAFEEAHREVEAWRDLIEQDHHAKIRDKVYSDPTSAGFEYRNRCNLLGSISTILKKCAKGEWRGGETGQQSRAAKEPS